MGTNPTPGCAEGNAGLRLLLPGRRQPLQGDGESEAEVRVFRRHLSLGGPREAPEAGTGPGWQPGVRGRAGAAQEKQFPPALLSFFHLQPALRAARGEVSGAGARVGVRGRRRPQVGGLLDGVRPGQPRGAPGRPLVNLPYRLAFTGLFCAGCAAGPRQRGQGRSGPESVPVYWMKVRPG